MHPLDGCGLKFSRAVEHLNALNDVAHRFNDSDSCTLVPEINNQTREIVLRVKILKSAPLAWAIVIGEIAHNLRSCLDHMVWQLALTQVPVPYNKTEFPIFIKSADYNRKGLGNIRDLPAPQKTFIEGLQPYHRGNDAHSDPLWLLHELNNTDKHRLLPIVNAGVYYGPYPKGEIRIFFPEDVVGDAEVAFDLTLHTKLGVPMEDGAKFVTLKMLQWVSPNNQMHVGAKVTQGIFFGEGIKANSGRKVDSTLSSIFNHVQSILSDCAKQFFSN